MYHIVLFLVYPEVFRANRFDISFITQSVLR